MLWGRCDEDVGAPFQPFVEAITRWATTTPRDVVAATARHPELSVVVPGLATELSHLPDPPVTDPDSRRWRMFDAVADLVITADAAAPVLVVVDDAHWATAPTLGMLAHLARSVATSPVAIVVTVRDTEIDRRDPSRPRSRNCTAPSPSSASSSQASTFPACAPTSRPSSSERLDQADDTLASPIYDDTNGNPFFVGQVIEHPSSRPGRYAKHDGRWTTGERSSNDAVPDGVRDIVNRRVARLSTEADRALTVAAVIGHEFDLRTLASIPARPEALPCSTRSTRPSTPTSSRRPAPARSRSFTRSSDALCSMA